MSCNHGNIVYSLESFLTLKKNHFASILPIRFPMIFQGFLFECPEVFEWSGYIAENHSDLTHCICPWSTWQGKAQRNLLSQRNLLLKAIKLEKFELSSLKGAFVLVHCTIPLFQKQIQIIKKSGFISILTKGGPRKNSTLFGQTDECCHQGWGKAWRTGQFLSNFTLCYPFSQRGRTPACWNHHFLHCKYYIPFTSLHYCCLSPEFMSNLTLSPLYYAKLKSPKCMKSGDCNAWAKINKARREHEINNLILTACFVSVARL